MKQHQQQRNADKPPLRSQDEYHIPCREQGLVFLKSASHFSPVSISARERILLKGCIPLLKAGKITGALFLQYQLGIAIVGMFYPTLPDPIQWKPLLLSVLLSQLIAFPMAFLVLFGTTILELYLTCELERHDALSTTHVNEH